MLPVSIGQTMPISPCGINSQYPSLRGTLHKKEMLVSPTYSAHVSVPGIKCVKTSIQRLLECLHERDEIKCANKFRAVKAYMRYEAVVVDVIVGSIPASFNFSFLYLQFRPKFKIHTTSECLISLFLGREELQMFSLRITIIDYT